MSEAGVAIAREASLPSAKPTFSERVDQAVERHAWSLMSVFVMLFGAACIGLAVHQRLWLDEVYTTLIVDQPSLKDVFLASRAGCDAQAPLFPILVRALRTLIPNEALALRLPSIAGFCTMAVCVFVLVKQRIGALYGFLAMLLAVCALLYYATEGRCYGLVLGFTSLTLLSWQRAARGGHRRLWIVGLVGAASFAVASQYYCVFFLGGLFLAELIYAGLQRRADVRLWIAILAPVTVLIPHLPLIRGNSGFFKHFWAPASLHSATSFYDTFLAQHAWVLVLGVVLYAMVHVLPDVRPTAVEGLPTREWLVYATLAITPILVVLFVLFTVKIYVPRYTIWAVPPIAICIVAGLHFVSRGSRLAPACGALPLCLLLVLLEGQALHGQAHLRTGQSTLGEILTLPANDTPIVIANHQPYLEIWYVASPELRKRLFYAVDPTVDMQYGWPDTGPAVFKVLRHWTPIQAPDLQVFLTQHSHFLVAADGRDWLPAHLLKLGYQLKPIRIVHTEGLESVSVIYDANQP